MGKRRESRGGVKAVRVAVLRCSDCSRLVVAINETRITSHKCSGASGLLLDESVAPGIIASAMAQAGTKPPRNPKGET